MGEGNESENPSDYCVFVSFLDVTLPLLSPVLASFKVCSILFGMVEIAACFLRELTPLFYQGSLSLYPFPFSFVRMLHPSLLSIHCIVHVSHVSHESEFFSAATCQPSKMFLIYVTCYTSVPTLAAPFLSSLS